MAKKHDCPTCGHTLPQKEQPDAEIKVIRDENAEDPRKMFDHVGTMACWHRRYNLGDEMPSCSPDDFIAELPEGTEILPLYLHDHGGITMATGDFGDPWDSGQVGIIFATPEKIREDFCVKRITAAIREKVRSCLRAEVKEYDHFLTGNVWGFTIEGGGIDDSCWGFMGDTIEECGMADHIPPSLRGEPLALAWSNRR